jgi:GTP cyclohydrolase I
MSYQPSKTDPELGLRVDQHLRSIGLHTPTTEELLVDSSTKIEKLETIFTDAMNVLGMDLSDDSLIETPKRVAKMWINEIYWGLEPKNFPKCTTVDNKMHYDEMVIERNITSMSTCEHHLVTIDAKAFVAYIPNEKVLGLSKLNRIVEYFSRRPQIQERLTAQIAETLKFILGTDNVAVVVDGVHYCVKSRGVEDVTSSTITSSLHGCFREVPEARAEFMNFVKV